MMRENRANTAPPALTPPPAPIIRLGKSSARLRVIPLGGLEEVGRNTTVIECDGEIVVVDIGFMFPSVDMPGVDYVLADTAYLEQNKDRIKGIVITHGHMDHTGALPYVIKKLGNPPVYGTKLTVAMIRERLEEFKMDKSVRLNEVHPDDTLQLGAFRITFFRVNHNIPDAVGVVLHTPAGTIVCTGDWKFDHSPQDGMHTEFGKIAKVGAEGVLLLCSDSTNAEKAGYCLSESILEENITALFAKTEGRIIVATFSSLVNRIQQVFNAAHFFNRKVAISGMSMEKTITLAAKLGFIKVPKGCLIKMDQVRQYPDGRVVVICTGSQGQGSSALGRMAAGEHRHIKIQPTDMVLLSSSPIPGNERAVADLMNSLLRLGAKVIYNKLFDIHASGHGQREELKMMLQLVRPKFFMPYHGERSMLVQHAEIATQMGMPKQNVFVLGNGNILEFNKTQDARMSPDKIEVENILVDGLGVGDIGNVVLRDRQVLAEDGMMVIICTLNRAGKLVQTPDIISRGFIYVKSSETIVAAARALVQHIVNDYDIKEVGNWAPLRARLRDEVGALLFQKTERRPMVLPVVIEV